MVLNYIWIAFFLIAFVVALLRLLFLQDLEIFPNLVNATFFSTLAGVLTVSLVQGIKLYDKVILSYLGGLTAAVGALIWGLSQLERDQLQVVSLLIANLTLFGFITLFIVRAMLKKVNVYEAFVEGGKEGFGIAIKIIPYLIAILVAIGVFRASGTMDYLIDGVAWLFAHLGVDTRFVDALPTALMKPLSGSGARGMMIDALNAFGVDSFAGRLASTVQGATDTTFYIIAVYFGSVGIRRTRHAVGCGLIADFTGIVAAILLGYLFFA